MLSFQELWPPYLNMSFPQEQLPLPCLLNPQLSWACFWPVEKALCLFICVMTDTQINFFDEPLFFYPHYNNEQESMMFEESVTSNKLAVMNKYILQMRFMFTVHNKQKS